MNENAFWISFWSIFWVILGPIWDPKTAPKMIKQTCFFGSVFRMFFWGLKALQVPLGSLPEPLMLLLRASPMVRSHSLKMMFLGTLRLLMSSLESSWRILAHSNPKTDPKTNPKINLKLTQNSTQMCSIFGPIFEHCLDYFGGPFWTPKIYRRNKPGLRKCGFTIRKLHFL